MTRESLLTSIESHWKFGVLILGIMGFVWHFSARVSAAESAIRSNNRRVAVVETSAELRESLLYDIRERVVRVETVILKLYEEKCLEDDQ